MNVYVLIWVIIAGSGNNVAATGSAEFIGKAACDQAATTITKEINPKYGFVRVLTFCQIKEVK